MRRDGETRQTELEVWQAYYDLRTATTAIASTEAQVKSAEQTAQALQLWVDLMNDGSVSRSALNWTQADVDSYISRYNVPVNALLRQGYASVGCWPRVG